MDVEDAVRKRGEELGLDDAHETSENDSVYAGALQKLDAAVFRWALQLRLPRRAVEILARNVVPLRAIEDLSVRDIGKDELDFRIERTCFDSVDN